jgi:hypothetical protein
MQAILRLLTPAFVDNLKGITGDIVRFFWPTKADTVVQVMGSVIAAVLAILAVIGTGN